MQFFPAAVDMITGSVVMVMQLTFWLSQSDSALDSLKRLQS